MATEPDGVKTIADFLVALAESRELFERWQNGDSHARRHEMDEFGLTPEQQAVVVLGDLKLLQAYLDYEYGQGYVQSGSSEDAGAPHSGTSMVVTYRPPPAPPPTYAPTRARRIPTY